MIDFMLIEALSCLMHPRQQTVTSLLDSVFSMDVRQRSQGATAEVIWVDTAVKCTVFIRLSIHVGIRSATKSSRGTMLDSNTIEKLIRI